MGAPGINAVYRILKKHVRQFKLPVVDAVEEKTRSPFHVLVSTILSARTKDETTAAAGKRLFKKAKDSNALEKLSVKEIERLIYPVGFYKNKARFLKKLPKALRLQFNGRIPETVEELVKLPGVGRKTANLVVVIAFKKPAVCVDTHVHRIMNRIGFVKTRTPLETENALRENLPKRYWATINSILVAFGQNHCLPVSPYCSTCPVRKHCNRVGVRKSR